MSTPTRLRPRRMQSALTLLAALTAAALVPAESLAQGLGIAGLLNPEGSRLFPQTFTVPRHPGKPDPRWKNFAWKYSDVEAAGNKLRLYFYREEEEVARFAIPRIRADIEYLSKVFNFKPKKEFTYILFTSHRDFKQADIFFVTEGVQGITSPEDLTMAVPYWGEADTFDHISLHEMVHQFEVQKIMHLSAEAEKPYLMAMEVFPLWFIEGMAEYYSLRGFDPESRMYIRDLLANPDPSRGYTPVGFFAAAPLSFVHTYKLGQAKIDFIEKKFGEGASQKVLEAVARDPQGLTFESIFSMLFDIAPSKVEKDWAEYLEQEFQVQSKALTQDLDDFDRIDSAGDTLDFYDVSPDGSLLAVREVDPVLGVSSIQLMDLSGQRLQKVQVANDRKPGTVTLFFFELPTLALGNRTVAYVAGTTVGPEIEFRRVFSTPKGKLRVGNPVRIELHEYGITEAHSLAISPDEKEIAFVGMGKNGQPNVYRIPLPDNGMPRDIRPLVSGWYAWKHLQWTESGIFGASDRTAGGQYNLFRIDPDSGSVDRLTYSEGEQLAPSYLGSGFSNGKLTGNLFFQSNESGSQQIHVLRPDGSQLRLTDVRTALSYPKLRGSMLYALGFKSGRFHLYRIPVAHRLNVPVEARPVTARTQEKPWQPQFASLTEAEVRDYRPFSSSGIRLENLGAFFGSGSVGGASAQISDLMRSYWIDGEFFFFGNIKYTNSSFFFSSQKGRATWTTGAYHVAEPRLDNVFDDKTFRTYLRREYGALGAIQYPLTAFSFVGSVLRVGGVARSEFSDSRLASEWEAVNPGTELLLAPTFRIGYDRLLYEMYAGPLKGFGTMLEAETSFFPGRGDVNQRLRWDIAYYLKAFGRSTLMFQGLAGGSWGGAFRDSYFVSSDDILRGYPFADERLRGNYVLAGKTEARFPIGSAFGFPPLRGLVAFDVGTISRRAEHLSRNFTTATTGGLQLNIPPVSLSFLLSFPGQVAPGPAIDGPVFHFTLRYLYL